MASVDELEAEPGYPALQQGQYSYRPTVDTELLERGSTAYLT